MPRVTQNTYRIAEMNVSRTDQGRYPHSRANVIDPYPKNTRIIDRLDGECQADLTTHPEPLLASAEGIR